MKALLATVLMKIVEKVGVLAFNYISDLLHDSSEKKKVKGKLDHAIKDNDRAIVAKRIADALK